MFLPGRGGQGQMQRKARALAHSAGDLYFTVMGFHYLLHQ